MGEALNLGNPPQKKNNSPKEAGLISQLSGSFGSHLGFSERRGAATPSGSKGLQGLFFGPSVCWGFRLSGFWVWGWGPTIPQPFAGHLRVHRPNAMRHAPSERRGHLGGLRAEVHGVLRRGQGAQRQAPGAERRRGAAKLGFQSYGGWTKSISHHLESMGNHCSLLFTGNT